MLRQVQPRLETIAKAPNILYPGKYSRDDSDVGFYDALELTKLRDNAISRLLPNSSDLGRRSSVLESRQSVYSQIADQFDFIFKDGSFDIGNANYRLDAQEYLRANGSAQESLQLVFNNLAHMAKIKAEDRHGGLPGFLKRAGFFCELVNGYKPFNNAPGALSKVNDYVASVKEAPAFRKLEEMVRKTKDGFDLHMVWRIAPGLEGKEVVSAHLQPIREDMREFSDDFELFHFNRGSSYGGESKPIEGIVHRAVSLKYRRHMANAEAQMNETMELLPQTAVYLSYLGYANWLESSRGLKFVRPIFMQPDAERAVVQGLWHPLVAETKPSVVGNPVVYESKNPITVLTGPNKGGKSVYLKSVGWAHALGLKGFLVPAVSAELVPRDGIYTHFVTSEDITKGESRFSDEMNRMGRIFKKATPRSLVLLDEPCSGTTLSAGEIKTRQFLNMFGKLGCSTFLTTHMEGIPNGVASGEISRSVNKHLGFTNNGGSLTYSYKLEDGPAKMDYGVQLADAWGLGEGDLEALLRKRAEEEGFGLKQ